MHFPGQSLPRTIPSSFGLAADVVVAFYMNTVSGLRILQSTGKFGEILQTKGHETMQEFEDYLLPVKHRTRSIFRQFISHAAFAHEEKLRDEIGIADADKYSEFLAQ